jgi:restriction endonuclease S subunit
MSDLKPGWQRVKFGELATCINDRVDDPSTAGVECYVGLEHLDPESLKIRRWGSPEDVESTKLRFKPGDIIFGKRRAYQRKLAVAEFEGICSAHAMVLRAKPDVVLPEFLPFFMQSDLFMERAVEISVGSLSPTINWKALAQQEFALPPLQEQQQMATALITLQNTSEAFKFACNKAKVLLDAFAMHSLRQNYLQKLKSSSSENGAAPNGWRVVSISELCSRITYGFTNPMPTTETGPWMVTAKDIGNGRINYFTARHTSDEAFKKELTDKSRPLPGDVLLSKDGTLGRVGVVGDASICVNQSVAVLRPLSSVPGEFLTWTLRSNGMQQRLLQDIGGTAIKHLYITKVGDTRLIVPEAKSEMESIALSL